MEKEFDKIIIGAGMYGMYAANYVSEKGDKVLVLECESGPFKRASYINQARVHNGYHYPRSLSTAKKSAGYFKRFLEDFKFCVDGSFEQIYAISKYFSWTNSEQFIHFCDVAQIPYSEVSCSKYFNDKMCEGAFLTCEYTYDADILKKYFLEKLQNNKNVELKFSSIIEKIYKKDNHFQIILNTGEIFSSNYILNATYSNINQIISLVEGEQFEKFPIKYELCEIILCEPSSKLKNIGITVMDGPFFSIMPFGKTNYHSLTSVVFTPHATSYRELPKFNCQNNSMKNLEICCDKRMLNCNECEFKPQTAWPYMSKLVSKYLKNEYEYKYKSSLFSVKPILKSSSIDDSRPTQIVVHSENPEFISVLSGKINTVYDLDEFLS